MLTLQAFLIVVGLALPFGFDHPSKLGLDFSHLLVLIGLDALAVTGGIIAAWKRRNWTVAAVQFLTPFVILQLGMMGVLSL
jgi:hypothetical protein